MIINLKGRVKSDGEINFDLTPLYFSSDDYVQVNQLFLQYDKKLSEVSGNITSSLVDRSSVNQNQELLFFHQSSKSRQLYFTPTHAAQYKIQSASLHSATFKLSLFEDTEKIDFRKIHISVYLQLKVETHARVFKKSATEK